MSSRVPHPAIRSAIGFVFVAIATRFAAVAETPVTITLWVVVAVLCLIASIQMTRQAVRDSRAQRESTHSRP